MDAYTYLKNTGAASAGKTPVRKSASSPGPISKSTLDRLEAALKAADEVLSRPEVKAKLAKQKQEIRDYVAKEQARKARESREANPAYQTLTAQADAADREAKEWERKASEKTEAVKRAPRELVSYYNDQACTMRANAEMARARSDSYRRAAAAL